MPKKHPQSFRGMPIDSLQLGQEIIQAFRELGDSDTAAIANWLGPPWSNRDCREDLNRRLVYMTRPGQPLERRKRGVYGLRQSRTMLGVDRAHRNDIAAKQELFDLGGIASFGEWLSVVDPDAVDEAKASQMSEGMTAAAILRRSGAWSAMGDTVRRLLQTGQVRRDFSNNAEGDYGWHHGMMFGGSDGIYNLPQNELAKCVLRGKWALRVMLHDEPSLEAVSDEDQRDLRDLFLIRVGTALRRAREAAGMSIADVLADADVSAAINNDWDLDYERSHIWNEHGQERWQERLLWRFENFAGRNTDYKGSKFRSVGGHLTAPASFYRTVAAKLGVDAAALSRGRVTALVR